MRVWVLGVAAVLATACGRPAPPLVEYRDPDGAFAVRHPAGWTSVRSGDRWRTGPPPAGGIANPAEFVLVVTRPAEGQLDDPAIRQVVFELLPIHGVSGFQQDGRTTPAVRWYKFEVTGAAGEQEWASVGAVASGAARYYVVVCAKPLAKWRDGQRQCDEVIRSFQPGDFNR